MRLTLFPARIFLALGWTRAGVEKVIDRDWWAGDYVRDFLASKREEALPFASWSTDWIGTRAAIGISFVVLILELTIGLLLFTGRRMAGVLATASALNIAFVALGAVNPSAFYLVIQLTLMLGLVASKPVVSQIWNLAAIGAAGVLALAMAPFITTMHPHGVIDDPAIMLSTLFMLVAATLAIRLCDHREVQRSSLSSNPHSSGTDANSDAKVTAPVTLSTR